MSGQLERYHCHEYSDGWATIAKIIPLLATLGGCEANGAKPLMRFAVWQVGLWTQLRVINGTFGLHFLLLRIGGQPCQRTAPSATPPHFPRVVGGLRGWWMRKGLRGLVYEPNWPINGTNSLSFQLSLLTRPRYFEAGLFHDSYSYARERGIVCLVACSCYLLRSYSLA